MAMTKAEMEALQAQVAALQAEVAAQKLALEAAKTANLKDISFKVSELGAVSVYGLGRFPVTLYQGQMDRLFNSKEQYESFKVANKDKLSTGKNDTRFAAIRAKREADKASKLGASE